MRNSLKLILLLLLGLAIGLVGCALNTSVTEGIPVTNLIETQIPGFENLQATPTNQENYFPQVLGCDQIDLDEVKPGFTWQNIQIGVTTFDEMVAELKKDWTDVNISFRETTVSLEFYNFYEGTLLYSNWLDACFFGDILVALRNSDTTVEFPLRLSDIIEIYGKPDVVTWGLNYWHRSLIWLDLGMLIEIELEYDENVDVYLFPPLSKAEFEDSWLNKILPKSIEGWGDPSLIDDLGRLLPKDEKEDLWGFTEWWRIFD